MNIHDNPDDLLSEKNKCITVLYATSHIVLVCIIISIFLNSIPDRQTSKAVSLYVTEKIAPFLELIVGKGGVTNHLVRKLAHFSEFFALGTAAAVCVIFRAKFAGQRSGLQTEVKAQSFVNASFMSVVIALCDETLQLFTGRGSQVTDVWLDIFGASLGIIIVSSIYAAVVHHIRMVEADY